METYTEYSERYPLLKAVYFERAKTSVENRFPTSVGIALISGAVLAVLIVNGSSNGSLILIAFGGISTG